MRDDSSAIGNGEQPRPDDRAARPMRAVAATLATPGQPRAHLDGLRLAQALDLGAQAAAFVLQRGDAALVCIVRGGVCRLGVRGNAARPVQPAAACTASGTAGRQSRTAPMSPMGRPQ